MRLKLNRAAALTLTGTAILATLSQVGGATPRSYIEGQDHENNNGEQVKADDLDGVSDPSKLSESDFAPGTRWTPVGWTRSNPQYMAKSSKLEIAPEPEYYPLAINYSWKIQAILNKDDIKKDNEILIGTIQRTNSFDHQQDLNKTIVMDTHQDKTLLASTQMNNGAYINGEEIGQVHVEMHDKGEFDIYLRIEQTKNYATDPRFTFNTNSATLQVEPIGDYYDYSWAKGTFPRTDYFVTNNQIVKIPMAAKNEFKENTDLWNRPYDDALYNYYGIEGTFSKDQTNIHRVVKVQSSTPGFLKNINSVSPTDLTGRVIIRPVDSKGITMNENLLVKTPDISHIVLIKENNSATDLLSKTPSNTVYIQPNTDGSYYIAFNVDADKFAVNKDQVTNLYNQSYYHNIQAPNDNSLQKTIDYYASRNNKPYEYELFANIPKNDTKAGLVTVTDLTPNLSLINNPLNFEYKPNGSTFDAELYRTALVHYYDEATDKPIANDSIMGLKNEPTTYRLNIPKGYQLDTKSSKNVDGKQYTWSADKKSIAYTFNEDQKLNDANPINIYLTHGNHNTNDNSGKSTRTIQYTGLPEDLKPKDTVQTVLFKRSGVTDDVTGETTYGDWQPQAGNGHYTAVTSPNFAGYKPDQAVVPDTAATPNKNENVTVNYSRTNQNAKLTVHDDTTNIDLNDYTENSTGLYQDQINFKTAPSAVEQELKDKGYNIVSDSFKGSPNYNADDSKNNFVIHVTHKIVPVTPDQPKKPTDVIPDTKQHYPTGVDTNDLNKDVQRSIFYKYEDNLQAEPTVVQKAHFNRTVKVDAVTQKIVDNGTWSTKDNYSEVDTKSIDGYTPDKTKVDSATPSMTTNQDQTVVYHANDEDAAITYIDDTTGKVLKTDTQKAKYKQTIKFATDPNTQIQIYKDQGYVLVSSDWKDGSTYQTDPARNKFTVHLKHGTSTVIPDEPKKPTDIIPGTKQHYPTGVDTNDLNQSQQRQITYTYADSKKQASPTVTQKATFHRTATVDNVTGKTTYTDWTTSDQYPEVKSPAIEGYTPDKSNVPVTKPALNQKQDVAVVYNPNPEQIDVIAQDNTGKQLSKSTLHGNYNTDYSATTPVIKGYHLIKMPANTHGTYKTHNDPIIYIYAPDSNSVPEQTDGTPKPDKSSYPNDLTPAKRSNKLPETGSTNLSSDLNSVVNNITNALQHLLH